MSKEPLAKKPFLLVINGPSCAGKSTVSDILFERYGGIYKGKSDAIKRLISDYDAPTQRELIHTMTIETIRIALANGLSAIKEGGSWRPETYVELAKAAKVLLFTANITAPWEIILARFEERMEARKQGAKISNADPKRLRELYDQYLQNKIQTELEFDSSLQTPEEIAEAIASYIKQADSRSL